MNKEILMVADAVSNEKGVDKDVIFEAIEAALASATRKRHGDDIDVRVSIDRESGEYETFRRWMVFADDSDELEEPDRELRLQDAVDVDPDAEPGEYVEEPMESVEFGRIAAQTAKQVIEQRLRDAKREQVYEQYEGREGDLVSGLVQQVDHRYTIIDLGDAEAIMPASERIPYERLDRGARVKAYIVEVRDEGRGAPVVVSRSHPDFIRALFELEVPELTEGIVEIKAIAREPGHRTKLAVISNDPSVDPVGACVGARGARVRQVVNELRGEKVDLIQWRDDVRQFITEALSPVRGVREVRIDDDEKEAIVIVPDNQLSLAIGKEGQNARLAARLTGYRIDIRPESNPEGLPEPEEDEETGGAAAATTDAGEAETQPAAGDATPDSIPTAEPADPAAATEKTVAVAGSEDDADADADTDAGPGAVDADVTEIEASAEEVPEVTIVSDPEADDGEVDETVTDGEDLPDAGVEPVAEESSEELSG